MKITIIQFSPSGNTLKVSLMLQKELESRGLAVQLVDITSNEQFFSGENISEFLKQNVKPHDVLLVGGPVYAHHLQYHMLDLLEALPRPDAIWGKYVVPYVTYGGIASGVALKEAADLLKASGRVVYAGMKVSAPHCMTRAFMDNEFNSDKLQADNLPQVTELADRIMQLEGQPKVQCNAKHLNYNGLKTALKAKLIFKEKLWHAKRYPQISINQDLCGNCSKCAKVCPVVHLDCKTGGVLKNLQSPCIHCFNCITTCPSKAISLIGDLEKGKAFMAKMIAKHAHKEMPETAIYPIL